MTRSTFARPQIRYARNRDLHIAYQTMGDHRHPIDLVIVPGFVSHCELDLTNPGYVDLVSLFTAFARVIAFDKRGTGLSDTSRDTADFGERMSDIGAVMDAAESERAVLFGYSEGGPLATLFAATHPQRVSSLILFNTFPSGSCIPEEMQRRIDDAAEHWGEGRSAGIFLSRANALERRFMALYERSAASPGAARAINEAVRSCDVSALLPDLPVPTTVIHRRDDPFALAEWGRKMADAIPHGRYVEIEGDDHLPWLGDVKSVARAVESHVTGGVESWHPTHTIGTVLFTDIVDSTATLSEIGDERWAESAQQHNDISRAVFDELDAWAVKSTGDGFMACFPTPEMGVRAAHRLIDAMPDIGVQLRAGLHIGEVERVDLDDIAGSTPTIAARISGLAGPAELLASRTVADLLAGSRYPISPHGKRQLKGIPTAIDIVRIGRPSAITDQRDFDVALRGSDRLTLRMARRMPSTLRALARLTSG